MWELIREPMWEPMQEPTWVPIWGNQLGTEQQFSIAVKGM